MKKNIKIVCDKCKHGFSLNAVNIKESPIDIGDDKLILMYFECPKCKKIYRVTLKDEKSEELLQILKKTEQKLKERKGCASIELVRKLEGMVNVRKEQYEYYINMLNNHYSGCFKYEKSKGKKRIVYLP